MFTDAGAHFMQSTTGVVRVQTVKTDELTDTFSDFYSMRLAISEKH